MKNYFFIIEYKINFEDGLQKVKFTSKQYILKTECEIAFKKEESDLLTNGVKETDFLRRTIVQNYEK